LDIRTKLALTLVFVSLLSMLLLGAFAYQTSSELLKEISIRQLDSLAESKAQDLSKVQEGWKDQVRLIRSSTDLKETLSVNDLAEAATQEAVRHIIEHTAGAVKNVAKVKIYDNRGNIMSWGESYDYGKPGMPIVSDDVGYGGAFHDDDGHIRIVMTTKITRDRHIPAKPSGLVSDNPVDENVLGFMEVAFNTSDLQTATSDHTGLGETGEIMVISRHDQESAILLNPRRHHLEIMPRVVPISSTSAVVQRVLDGESGIYIDSYEDYRGQQVWAATRYLPDVEWGLVVKVDTTEEELRADTLLEAMFDIGIALSAFAIIGGTLLGFYLARPIHELAVLVERVRKGETDLRAEFEGDDEIAYLAESLNELLDHVAYDESDTQEAHTGPKSSDELDTTTKNTNV
jgi:hypothetical protein